MHLQSTLADGRNPGDPIFRATRHATGCESAALPARGEASDAGELPCSRSAQNYYRELNKPRQSEISVIKFLDTISPLSATIGGVFHSILTVRTLGRCKPVAWL
jgi:hypothetical protein